MNKYKKNLEKETKKMWHLKITNVPAKVGAFSMIKNRTDKRINKILTSPSRY